MIILQHLDPTRLKHKRHIFWRLMTLFLKEYIILACMMTIEVNTPVVYM